jgi:hypothetical protein
LKLFKEKVAGIKKGFTFALPITTTICKTKVESERGNKKERSASDGKI